MAQQIITTHFEPSELKTISDRISESIKGALIPFLAPAEPQKQILTRQEAAAELSISLPTLHDYTKRGIIQAYRLGYKVRYKREDINKSLSAIKSKVNG